MADEGITSPPFPTDVVTAKGLYRYLQYLQSWLAEALPQLQGEMLALAQKESCPAVRAAIERSCEKLHAVGAIPPITVWEGVSLNDAYLTLQYVRTVREAWDTALREHEDSWDCKLAVFKRYSALLLAQTILDEGFTSPEVREMKQQKAYAQRVAQTAAIRKRLRHLLPPEMQDDAETATGPDPDGWFGGPPPEPETGDGGDGSDGDGDGGLYDGPDRS